MSIKLKDMTVEMRKACIADLCDRFRAEKEFYTSKDFVESEARSKFIDPFLECLKWDVKNEKGARPDKREVITEDRIVVAGSIKHPDYTLCYGGLKKIYIEAKAPSVSLKTNVEPALQVRRYAYTAKMLIAILTNFEELAIYDARIKPQVHDSVATARIEYLKFDQYVEKFEELYDHISWDAVDLGKFDSYYEGIKDKKGTKTVDEDILEMIESWRVLLALDIALHNEQMNETALTTCVQKIIDRILFLRICEDKEIEEMWQLKKIAEKKSGESSIKQASLISTLEEKKDKIYPRLNSASKLSDSNLVYSALKKLFEKADKKFNAGLFANDEALNSLKIQDKTLISIINELYYPICQYEFSVLPVEILASIYERFLGKVIRFKRKTKNGHSIEIFKKNEVQKAGGVYYTPSYIVEYIIWQTVGKKLENASLAEVARLKICDPSCGSGSFLVGAYQCLLDWHMDYYYKEERRLWSEKKGLIYKDARSAEYKLNIEEKRRILLCNIFGVDIDVQAVEVTKLSLFLKLLENEGASLSKWGQASLFKASELKKILPSLSENIKCGNALIGTDYYDGANDELFNLEVQKKVNAFDWEKEFACVFQNGGFDCVVGNPPYVICQPSATTQSTLEYYKKYSVASYKIDLFHLFFEKAIKILKKDGMLGFITPNTYLTNKYTTPLRSYILSNCDIARLVIHNKVFKSASVDVATIILNKKKIKNHKIIIEQENKDQRGGVSIYNQVRQEVWQRCEDFIFNINKRLKIKLIDTVPLGSIFNTYFGIQAFDRKTSIATEKLDETYLPIIDGEDIFSYRYAIPVKFFHYKKENIKSGGKWNVYNMERIVIRQIGIIPVVGLSEAGHLASNTLYSLWSKTNTFSLYYILCILNSKLIKYVWKTTYSDNKTLFPKIKGYQLRELPIKVVSLKEQETLISYAKDMIDAQKQLQATKFDNERKFLKQRIELLNKKIDGIVYSLYRLSKDDIELIEDFV